MDKKEYIVSLKANIDYDQFWNEMETNTNQHPFIPDHAIDIVNVRPGSQRSCHYALTDQEAEILRSDPRIYSVEIPPQQRDDIQIALRYTSQSGDFTKTTSDSGSFINWGLRRCINYGNLYGAGTTISGPYNYLNDGTGVDVVIQDSGIEHAHPEFRDGAGASRVQLIDWYTESGIPGSQSPFHYRDYDGHGTHVAGIAAGKNYGWAKNSRIYSLKIAGLEGSGDLDVDLTGTGISVTDCFDVIKLWHQNKPIDPGTGVKRPTVVNMSWAYISYYTSINGGSYRGTPWAGSSRRTDYGMIGYPFGLNYVGSARVGSVDSDIEEMIAAGITVVIAAGNNYEKIDDVGGLDYDNYYTKTGVGSVYYHRGSSPFSSNALRVGSTDTDTRPSGLEQKSEFSNHGPGVDISAPGSNIMSCTSNTNKWGSGSQSYYLDSLWKQTNISGTSMASPQVAGVAALYLQSNPAATPADVKSFLLTQSAASSGDRIYNTGLNNDYTDTRSLWGGEQNFLYWPFSETNTVQGIQTKVSGNITFKGNFSFKT